MLPVERKQSCRSGVGSQSHNCKQREVAGEASWEKLCSFDSQGFLRVCQPKCSTTQRSTAPNHLRDPGLSRRHSQRCQHVLHLLYTQPYSISTVLQSKPLHYINQLRFCGAKSFSLLIECVISIFSKRILKNLTSKLRDVYSHHL